MADPQTPPSPNQNPQLQFPQTAIPKNPLPGQNPFAAANPGYGVSIAGQNNPETLFPPVPKDVLPIVIGDSGTFRYGGFFHEEYDSAWQDMQNRVDTAEEMRRGDGRCSQALKAIKVPFLSANYDITIDSDDPEDKEICQFCKDNIFSMERGWKEFLREALTYFDFGVSVFEIIWEFKNGQFFIKDLAPRIQHSILRWKLMDGTRGIVQILRTDEVKNYYVEIPINKCVVFTNDMEGDDITGMSILRSAYKHFYLKNNLYNIAAISAERYGVGTPVLTMPGSAGDQDISKSIDIIKNLRSNEQSYVVLPNKDWTIQILTPQGRSTAGEDIKDQIQHHDQMILASILASFLGLATDKETGSYALAQDAHGFFLSYAQDRVNYFADAFTTQIIKKLVNLNFGKRKIYPKLSISHVGEINKADMATWIKVLTDSGFVVPNLKMKEFINNNFDLPKFTDEEKELMEAEEARQQVSQINIQPKKNVDEIGANN